MKHLLPKLKIFRARYPETASAVLLLLKDERIATRRRFTRALPDTSTHVIRGTLLDLQKNGLITRSIDNEYILAVSPAYAAKLTPLKMGKTEECILMLLDKRPYITARKVRQEFDVSHSLFLQAVKKLIERGLVDYTDVPLYENSVRKRRHYTFKSPEKNHATS
ncbi:MarR family transcriptional regulator [Pantoea anthophila]|uniref:MarR family transcriptional regulator n=1 Tax=Pantoea anthophila TaxID=470931 RepID=UPI000614CB7C|nr:helix-turn-helix domain-containing protein [Pantoea anthophila]KKB02653.1 hypothetical protein TN98_20600 [Pantoea anthophila]